VCNYTEIQNSVTK